MAVFFNFARYLMLSHSILFKHDHGHYVNVMECGLALD